MCTSLLTLAGCSKEESIDPFYNEQHPIELGVGVESPMTRSVVTDGTGNKTLKAFTSATDIWMVMKSDYVALSGDNTNPNDLDFKGGQTSKYCVTMGTTGDKVTDKDENVVNFELGNLRYWDDIHSRSSRLSVWALAVPNKKSTALWSISGWNTSAASTTKEWAITPTQTSSTIKDQDLCFSNNKADYSSNSGSDERMKFNISSPNAFDKGKLIFYHALTKITINLVEGAGFNNSSTDDFNIDNGVTLNGFNLKGTFNVATGEFPSTTGTAATTMACGDKSETGYTLEALVMPGRDLSTTLADAVTFSIDKNKYTVSNETLLKALKDNSVVGNTWTTMEAGKNYVFTFTIKMTDIKVTATVAEWDNVTADVHEPKININEVYGQEGNQDINFTLYRSTTKADGYLANTHANVTYADGAYTMSPQLYWPNHETHYFFRGIYPTVGVDGTPTDKVSGSAITVANAAYSQGTYPSDLMLGYPRNADGSADETCKVHTSPVTQGICATEGDIHMNFQYVMSQVEVKLTTSTGDDKVVLDENTTIQILNGYKSGSITLENGTATYTESDKGTYTFAGGTYADRLDAIIPQSLTDLKFKITVQDAGGHKDSYEATIADIFIGGSKISSWEPGKHYIYTLNITKTGIKITATLKDWETVTSDENHIWM